MCAVSGAPAGAKGAGPFTTALTGEFDLRAALGLAGLSLGSELRLPPGSLMAGLLLRINA